MSVSIHFLFVVPSMVERIRTLFNELPVGEIINLVVPHRDLAPKESLTYYNTDENGITTGPFPNLFTFLPDRWELPNTFSFKQIIEDSLNAICTQAHPDLAELDYSGEPLEEGLGYWKLLDLKIEDGYIHATIKKL